MYCAFCGMSVTYEIYICCDCQLICIDCALDNPNFCPKFQCNSCGRELGNRIFFRIQTVASDLQRQMAMSYNRNYVPYELRNQQMQRPFKGNLPQRGPQIINQRQHQMPIKINRANFNQSFQRNYQELRPKYQNYGQINSIFNTPSRLGSINANSNMLYANHYYQNSNQAIQSQRIGISHQNQRKVENSMMQQEEIEANHQKQGNKFTAQNLQAQKNLRRTLPRNSSYLQMSTYENQQLKFQGNFDYERHKQQKIKRGLKMGLDGLLDDQEDEARSDHSPTFSFNYGKCIADAHYVTQSKQKESFSFGKQEFRKKCNQNNANKNIQTRKNDQYNQGRINRSSSAINLHRNA